MFLEGVSCCGGAAGAVIFCPAPWGFWPAVLQRNNCMDEKRNMGFRGKHGSSLLCVKTKA